MDTLDTPFRADLFAAVEAAYDSSPSKFVTADLDVCECPVCMTEATRLGLERTPIRDWDETQVKEYSNSAHEVPYKLDDLWSIWPRYLDLMARDCAVDDTGVGCELRRFGEAIYTDRGPGEAAMAIYADWARLMIAHFGWLEAREADNNTSPSYLLEVLIAGGVPDQLVRDALMELFHNPEYGAMAVAQFAQAVGRDAKVGYSGKREMLFALGYTNADIRHAVIDWLNTPEMTQLVTDSLAVPLTERQKARVEAFLELAGTFQVDWIPDHFAGRRANA